MKTELQQTGLDFSYPLINLQDIPAEQFLQADTPEEVILAILGHLEPNRVEEIAEMILEKIKDLTLETSEHQKYVLQLEMISKLRGLQFLIAQKIQDMAIQYNLRDDLRYLQGVEQGKLEGKLEGQKETLQAICQRMYKLGLSTAEIAEMIGLTEEQVQSFIPQ